MIALGAFVVSQRCDMARERAEAMLADGVQAWADGLGSDAALADAEGFFEEAAAASLDPSYALFCVTAIHEVRGTFQHPAPPSEAWRAAVSALREQRWADAQRLFGVIGGESPRAASFVRLSRELGAAARSD